MGHEKRRAQPAAAGPDEQRFAALRALRNMIARANGVPGYALFSDASLREMSQKLPQDMQGLKSISGIGDFQLKQYGAVFLDFIGKLDDMLGQRTSWDTAAFTQLVQASYIVDAPWSSSELSKLKAQAAMGLPLESMARALDRSRESVQSKLTELGLKASF